MPDKSSPITDYIKTFLPWSVIPLLCIVAGIVHHEYGWRWAQPYAARVDATTAVLGAVFVIFVALPLLLKIVFPRVKPKLSFRTTYQLAFSALSVALIFIYGFLEGTTKFKVDSVTIILLAFAALPVLQEYLGTIKAGNVELSFRELSVRDQVFVFLDGIARQQVWTFYEPRHGEKAFGEAFSDLVKGLINSSDKRKLVKKLNEWLGSGNDNLIYFASEVIGYFRKEFRENFHTFEAELSRIFKGLPGDFQWSQGQLNSLWAYSRYDKEEYASLIEFLFTTSNDANRRWVIEAITQMVKAKLSAEKKGEEKIEERIEGKIKEALGQQSMEELKKAVRQILAGA